MKKNIFCIIICTLFIATTVTGVASHRIQTNGAIQPPVEWSRIFGGPDDDFCLEMQMTNDGGFIMVGNSDNYLHKDIYLVKTTAEGNMEWGKTKGNTDNEEGNCVQQTDDGGYIVVGSKYNSGSGLNKEGYWIKTNADGITELEVTGPGLNGNDICYCVQQTEDGGYITIGTTDSYSNVNQIWLVKKNAYFVTQWTKNLGSQSEGYWVECTNDGGFIIAGKTQSPTHASQMILSKMDDYGNEEWFKSFGGTNSEYSWSVKQTSDDGYIIAGYTTSYGNGGYDMYIIKTDRFGNKQWEQTIGTPINELGFSIAETYTGGYFIVGYRTATWSEFDVFAAQLDDSGNIIWVNIYGEIPTNDYGVSGFQLSDGGFIIAGTTESYGANNKDFWLFKLETENNPPDKPIIIGPNKGKSGVEHTYSITGIEPDGDKIFYYINWGDGTEVDIGPFNSGDSADARHTWSVKGDYIIEVIAYDVFDAQSDKSTLSVSMPKNKSINTPLYIFLQNYPMIYQLLQRFLNL